MSWSDRAHPLAADVRLGLALHRAEWPWRVWLAGRLLPELVRMLVYVLVGSLVAGAPGREHALVGCLALVVAGLTVGEVTDLPSVDVRTGTYRAVVLGRTPALIRYAARAVWSAGLAVMGALAYAAAVPALTGSAALAPPLLARVWLLLPGVVGCVMLGLVVIAPAIGSSWEGLTYNAAIALVTVTSGAVIAPPGALAAVGTVLPLAHTVAALRASLSGRPATGELLLETLVAAGWGCAAWAAYSWQESRGRRRAVGAFVA